MITRDAAPQADPAHWAHAVSRSQFGKPVAGFQLVQQGNIAERLFRDAREATIGEGTSQMQVLQIGQAWLGVSAVC